MTMPTVTFCSPRRLPDPGSLPGRVVVLDIAFAANAGGGVSFETTTLPFIAGLGDRLAAWIDHHDHPEQARFQDDERFILATKQQAGACPEMITPALVERIGPVDSILAHLDLDGLYAAAKWLRRGKPAYPEADADSRAVDTREGEPSPLGKAVDQALRVKYRDESFRYRVLGFLVEGAPRSGPTWAEIKAAGDAFAELAEQTRQAASRYKVIGRVAIVRLSPGERRIDKTYLLLLGQEIAPVAVVQQSGMITVAAPFGSGFDFPPILGIGGGMPTRASAPQDRLERLLEAINGKAD
ncbi:MAG: hypothetical protein RBU30_12690 [Polyangia bacterium]|jgi:hypothetical protein|nr:hypothetical protein [Polyangia bacterium]